ncbi:MAG TPA: DUF2917 domain-containing protein [Burkholderiales bacterium]|nr:DUF2917 domain-containing protein [Burkholderiales bacterium]
MNIDIRNSRLFVPESGLIAIRDGIGTRIVCHSGAFWITQEGRIRDDILNPGEELVVQSRGRTIVTSLADGEVTLAEPGRSAGRATAPAWWQHLFRTAPAPANC